LNKIRTFLSLNFDSAVKDKASEILRVQRESFRDYLIKWEKSEKFHLTLRFLGDIDEKQAELLSYQLDNIAFSFDKIAYVTNGIGFFPNARRPNVIFIGLEEEGNNSGELVNKIDAVISEIGIKPDKKFVAHITLGRFRRENRKGAEGVNIESFEPFRVEFNSFFLMKSVLDYRGSEYFPIKEFNFKKN